jgi:chemotaxis protein CheZ
MGEPRKIFRIEEMAAKRLAPDAAHGAVPSHYAEVMQELAALRAALGAASFRQESKLQEGQLEASSGAAEQLMAELRLALSVASGGQPASTKASAAPLARLAEELEAVVTGTEQATQKILSAAEQIDQTAANLTAALKGKIEQGLAQDIQDLVIRIFEACNFQDLTGQRVTKVLATLKVIENLISRLIDELAKLPPAASASGYLHGPRLDTDSGHATQRDIDALFELQLGGKAG